MEIRNLNSLKPSEREVIICRSGLDFDKIVPSVREIVDDVRQRKDLAIIDYTSKFDGVTLTKENIKVSQEEIDSAYQKVSENLLKAVKKSISNIRKFHKKQIHEFSCKTQTGVRVSQIVRPLERIGIYVPGGRAAYPSTVLMTAVPARLVGVEKIMVCTPPREDGKVNPAVLVACNEAGVNEIYRVGGVQAVAAMAYGTQLIPKVEAIFGPGNIYVTAAKIYVSKDVRIDLPAGPSELLIISDDTGNPKFIAADLVSQAEHDPQARVILVTTSENLALQVEKFVKQFSKQFFGKDVISKSLENLWILISNNLDEAVEFSNNYAPEHLEIYVESPKTLLTNIKNAGAIFLGPFSPVAVGDYSAGSNHVLPTGGFAKSYSGLSSYSFIKTISVVECSYSGLKGLADTVVTMADAEGLLAHAESIRVRFANEK
ncbi:MAG: histidinol dehydrogenase [Candidatus Jordarchaeum sp.]|uniref:histidinol dehydrogenase n=1 Tax=Candidatus Jordarchaeum sp. TaxID=2823881 RepID=UPI00404906B3